MRALVVLWCCARVGSAQDTDRSAVESWLDREWSAAAEAVPPPSVAIQYAIEITEVPSQMELDSLRARVSDRPDHPERENLEIFERRIANGPDRMVYTAWFASDMKWRLSQTNEYLLPEVSYWDVARDGETTWGMSANQLTTYDFSRGPSLRFFYAEHGVGDMGSALNELMYGRMRS
ncbi:MAG: hypothetical protein ACF8LL_09675, partial [Phycisphaerales bacterium]